MSKTYISGNFNEEEGFLTTSRLILLTFGIFVVFLFGIIYFKLVYLYFANQAYMKAGGQTKKKKKNKTYWNYGD